MLLFSGGFEGKIRNSFPDPFPTRSPPRKSPLGFKAETTRERELVPSGGDFSTGSRANVRFFGENR